MRMLPGLCIFSQSLSTLICWRIPRTDGCLLIQTHFPLCINAVFDSTNCNRPESTHNESWRHWKNQHLLKGEQLSSVYWEPLSHCSNPFFFFKFRSSACLCLPSARVKGVCHHAQLHGCNFAAVLNCNVKSVFSNGLRWSLWKGCLPPPPRGCDPQVENHWSLSETCSLFIHPDGEREAAMFCPSHLSCSLTYLTLQEVSEMQMLHSPITFWRQTLSSMMMWPAHTRIGQQREAIWIRRKILLIFFLVWGDSNSGNSHMTISVYA